MSKQQIMKMPRAIPQRAAKKSEIPLEYLMGVSVAGLENFMLKHLAQASNIEKEMRQLLLEMRRQIVREEALAELARFLIDHRTEMLQRVGDHLAPGGVGIA